MVALALVSSGALLLLYNQLKGVGKKVIEKSDNKVDDALLVALEPMIDKLAAEGQEKLKELLERKLADEQAKDDAE